MSRSGRDAFDALPPWVAAVASRLTFFARGKRRARRQRRALGWWLRALGPRLATPGGAEAAAVAFCGASLNLAEAAIAVRPDLAAFRPDFARLCAMARAELAGARDDRPLLAAVKALEASSQPVDWTVAQLPGRVVFLAALAGSMPEAAAEAAVMLVNDLAALGPDLPAAALAWAAGCRGAGAVSAPAGSP